MVVIVSCIIEKDGSILMVKEERKNCYKWGYPAGHVEQQETIEDAALREVLEETGCSVKLTGVLPVHPIHTNEKDYLIFPVIAKLQKETIQYDKKKFMDVKWIPIDEIINMSTQELHYREDNIRFLKDFLDNNHSSFTPLLNNKEKITT